MSLPSLVEYDDQPLPHLRQRNIDADQNAGISGVFSAKMGKLRSINADGGPRRDFVATPQEGTARGSARGEMRDPMNKFVATAAVALGALALSGTAHAGDAAGKIQIKLFATGVLPDGKVSQVKNDTAHLVSTGAVTNTSVNDNVVPTVAIEYFVTPNVSVETICCVTAHHVTISSGALAGKLAVDNVKIIPATFTAKYHLPLGAITPYVGVGPTLFLVISDRPSDVVKSVGVTRTHMSSELGVAVQAGADVAIGGGYSLSLDAKKYWVSTTARFDAGTTTVLETRHKLNPWVLSGGVAYRF
jgi:outer membrane protein